MIERFAFSKTRLTLALVSSALLVAGCDAIRGYKVPEWSSVARTGDGRQFVTDGSIALEVSYVDVEPLPSETSRPWFAAALSQNDVQERRELFSFREIRAVPDNPDVVVAPGNLYMEANHVNYLSSTLRGHNISFWQGGPMQPVVVVVDGRGQGAIMPVSQN